MKDEFFTVLSSDNSRKYFPNNNASNFTVQLPHEIQLHNSWQVALVEIHYPQTILHIPNREEKNWVRMTTTNSKQIDEIFKKQNYIRPPITEYDNEIDYMIVEDSNVLPNIQMSISHGNYDNVKDLIDEINGVPILNEHLYFEIIGRGFVKITKKCKEHVIHTVEISEHIRRILGSASLEPITLDNKRSSYTFNFPAVMNNSLPSLINVYSDICEPYITGDSQTPLLRSFLLDRDTYHFGSSKSKEFTWLNYVSLQRSEFRTIEINIRDQHCNIIPFEYGTLTVALHFKKI